jgi:hypothetical protein
MFLQTIRTQIDWLLKELGPRTLTTSQSLSSTMSVTRQFKLEEGDHLRWEIQAKQDKLIIVVSRRNS